MKGERETPGEKDKTRKYKQKNNKVGTSFDRDCGLFECCALQGHRTCWAHAETSFWSLDVILCSDCFYCLISFSY